MNSFGVFFDNIICSILIEGLLKGRDVDVVNGLVYEMVFFGMNIDFKMYDFYICVMLKEGVMEKVIVFFDGMIVFGVILGVRVFVSLVEGYV